MLLRAEYIALALQMQEMADGKADLTERGARNSRSDMSKIQAVHDHSCELGANCSMAEAYAVRRDAFCKATSLQEALSSLGDGPETASLRKHCKVLFESSLDANTRRELLAPLFEGCIGNSNGHAHGNSASERRGTQDTLPTNADPATSNREGDHSGGNGVPRETSQKHSTLSLVEAASTLEKIVLREARADYEIKLIAPGKGSSAFYPAEVLKRDGPSVFRENTHVYLNHPTASEEAQRPEGDVKNLAGVLTTAAVYHEAHAKGPGLYARMKVFADHGQLVEEKAAHVGMSIRASGIAEAGGKLRDGLPVLKQLTAAESVDIVTKAGAGGMVLTESAGGAATNLNSTPNGGTPPSTQRQSTAPTIQTQEAAMDAAELTKLQESIKTATDAAAAANAAYAKVQERAIRGDAREEAARILAGITLPDASKARVIEAVLGNIPKTEAGELDTVKFAESVASQAKAEGIYVAGLIGAGAVVGMGTAPVQTTEAEKPEEINARAVKVFQRLGLSESAAKSAVQGRVA